MSKLYNALIYNGPMPKPQIWEMNHYRMTTNCIAKERDSGGIAKWVVVGKNEAGASPAPHTNGTALLYLGQLLLLWWCPPFAGVRPLVAKGISAANTAAVGRENRSSRGRPHLSSLITALRHSGRRGQSEATNALGKCIIWENISRREKKNSRNCFDLRGHHNRRRWWSLYAKRTLPMGL